MKKTELNRAEQNTLKARALDKLFEELKTGYALIKNEKNPDHAQTVALCFIKTGLYNMRSFLEENEIINSLEAFNLAEIIKQI